MLAAMQSRSPTLEGFRAMLQRPSVGLAEIAWRWSFGAACVTLLVISCLEYLDTLPVSPGDLLLLRSRQPALIWHAMARIFSGSALRAITTLVALAVAFSIAWLGMASLGRFATLKALLAYFRRGQDSRSASGDRGLTGLGSLLGLNLLRVAVTVAAVVGALAAFLIGGAASAAEKPAPAAAFLIYVAVLMLVWWTWSVMNWLLSLSAVFVVAEARHALAAIASAIDLVRHRSASVFAAGFWFGLAHITAFVAATSIVAFPLELAEFLPRGAVLGGVVAVTLLYFAAVDFLYIGRLGAYVGIVELPGTAGAASLIPPQPWSSPDAAASRTSVAVDADELILSDVVEDD
jgi:hypothetical protein